MFCRSGLEKLTFEKDRTSFPLNEHRMLCSFLVPTFPVFANSTALWTIFGPKRSVNSAEMMIYHLWSVRKTLTEQQMVIMASRQLRECMNVDFLFQSKGNNVRNWVIMHINLLVVTGLIVVLDFLKHTIQVFCLLRQDTLRFDILPKNAGNADNHAAQKVDTTVTELYIIKRCLEVGLLQEGCVLSMIYLL